MILASTLVLMFALLEVGVRLIAGISLTDARNFVETKRILLKGAYPSQYDAKLGWIPKPGEYEPDDNIWNTKITIDANGIRANGGNSDLEYSQYPGILAVGDSFTFGDEVDDSETWPAILEVMSRVQVINAGVFGYGFDQTVLRAEMLVDVFNPQIVIVGLIPDDVSRTELSIRGSAAKPYFEIINDNLALKNVPPDPSRPEVQEMGLVRSIFGHSAFLDVLMNVANLQHAWYGIALRDERVHERGAEVSCRLLQRIDELGDEKGFKTVFLIQYLESEIYLEKTEDVKTIVACAEQNDIPVLDLYSPLKAIAETNEAQFKSFFEIHMTPTGNSFVAERLHEFLISRQLIPFTQ